MKWKVIKQMWKQGRITNKEFYRLLKLYREQRRF